VPAATQAVPLVKKANTKQVFPNPYEVIP